MCDALFITKLFFTSCRLIFTGKILLVHKIFNIINYFMRRLDCISILNNILTLNISFSFKIHLTEPWHIRVWLPRQHVQTARTYRSFRISSVFNCTVLVTPITKLWAPRRLNSKCLNASPLNSFSKLYDVPLQPFVLDFRRAIWPGMHVCLLYITCTGFVIECLTRQYCTILHIRYITDSNSANFNFIMIKMFHSFAL